MKKTVKIFNSISELENFISSTERFKGNEKIKSSERKSERATEFTGTADFTEASNLFRNGYTYGMESLQKEMTGLAKNYKTVTTVKNDVFGVVPNVGALMTGHPQNMINIKTEKRAAKTKVVNMVVNATVPGRCTTQDITEMGAATLLQLIRLERNGFKVNLYICNKIESAYDKNEMIYIYLKIKSSSESLNLLKVAYPLVHPSFLRRHIFAVLERITRLHKEGYGYPSQLRDEDLRPMFNPINTIIVNYREMAGGTSVIRMCLKNAIDKVIK